jgi:Leucine-rich repeat (LRR) protein
VSSNRISSIAPLDTLANLNSIVAAHNIISEIPPFLSSSEFVVLNFSYNTLTTLRQLETFINLRELNVHANFLKSTRGIKNLTKLETLFVSKN